jgi:transcriptional regulator with XRE-family HTH domain
MGVVNKLRRVRYRRAFAAAHVRVSLSLQLKSLRRDRGLTQAELAEQVGMRQERISQIEDPNYGRHSITTLSRLAEFYDVVLDVKFVSFDKLIADLKARRSEDLAPQSYPWPETHP